MYMASKMTTTTATKKHRENAFAVFRSGASGNPAMNRLGSTLLAHYL